MRYGYPLKYFKNGASESYVYDSSSTNAIEDYGDKYNDNRSFCELIGTFIRRATDDEKYTWKMVKILAKKLGVEDDLREKPLDSDEWFDKVLNRSDTKKKCSIRKANSKQKA